MSVASPSKRPSPAPSKPPPPAETVADLLKRLGGVPAWRVRLHPTPGTATETDVLKAHDRDNRLCELVEGTLVEKTVGFLESEIAVLLATSLSQFVKPRNLGIVVGADGTMCILGGLVRIPDVAFVSWDRLPGRKRPKTPIPALAPDLAVEVLSKGNTKSEIQRKLREYFQAGTRLVWLVDPKTRTVRVHTGPRVQDSIVLTEEQRLDGGDVLPGFTLRVGELFPPPER